ncbi:MAG: malate synthase A [Thaumarchaeota archaeon]|nr:malate synthase A [Nitrososphaerota archaeon]
MSEDHDIAKVLGGSTPESDIILNSEALDFIVALHRKFDRTRKDLLARRVIVQAEIDAGKLPEMSEDDQSVADQSWSVASSPDDLQDRRVEITGPVDRKMMINALNSGACAFMADLEDSLSPSWANVVKGQKNLMDAVRRTISFESAEGKSYKLKENIATLLVRPRGWHLEEKHLTVDGAPVSASLFDFGLYFFHNAKELIQRGTGPYFYLAKLENYYEARLWNDVFNLSQDLLGIPRGTIRATVLIETILAALQMDQILYELRTHSAGLNAGRWDYIFSVIKKFRNNPDFVLPDRAQILMTVPFMRSYTEALVKTCHKRGAHAIGGMAAFVPSRKDPEINAVALEKVRDDKEREASEGFDGTWVAHPDLVPVARDVFDKFIGDRQNQKDRLREEVSIRQAEILNVKVPGGNVTQQGLQNNVSVALQYLESWMRGVGAVTIYNLMEDTATAEIARAQLWQWIVHKATLEDGNVVTTELYRKTRAQELAKLEAQGSNRFAEAAKLLDSLVESPTFVEFLTQPAYQHLE